MNLANDWLATAWTQTWQALVLVVAIIARLAAANRPQLAYVLWLVVLLKCVTPPLWSSSRGRRRLSEQSRREWNTFVRQPPPSPYGSTCD
jgi:hypothetical protein